jgi:hypothetical protein
MRCFSLVANGYIATSYAGALHGVGAVYVPDVYPVAKPGLSLDATDRALKVGFSEKVFANEALLNLSPDTGAITRDARNVTVLRCSVKTEANRPVLVPEEAGDEQDALVLIDVGAGRSSFIKYTVDPKQLVMHSRADGELNHERILVRLKPFDSAVVAVRSDLKWIFWGEERVKELLHIRYDGKNVFYETSRPGRG